MSMTTKTDTPSPALYDADSHDRIRVQGARVNNLRDISVELPKRRLTVFTGVSGSGNGFTFNVPSARATGRLSIEKGIGKTDGHVSGSASK